MPACAIAARRPRRVTAEGPLVVYRDRSRLEERDIAVVRRRDGRWEEPRALPADLWRIEGCPVNGPAVAAHDRRVAVAWFTAANDVPRVRLAFSADAGASFGAPVTVDDGNPLGRVGRPCCSTTAAPSSAGSKSSPDGSSLRVRKVHADGKTDASIVVVPAGNRISNGFPQMVRSGDNSCSPGRPSRSGRPSCPCRRCASLPPATGMLRAG